MIKYRVWDTQEKKYRDDLYFFIATNGELLWSYELTDGLYPTDPQRFIIEQYTGLKDKNGVEIVVGDIVKCTTAPDYDGESLPCVGRVLIENGCFCVDEPNRTELLFVAAPIEVIGNVHENADLLEEKS